MYPGRVVIYGKVGKKYALGFSTLVVNLLFLMAKNKNNHENTKYRKHEIIIFSFSCFRLPRWSGRSYWGPFVLS
jgi:hypothetical protein